MIGYKDKIGSRRKSRIIHEVKGSGIIS